MEIYTAIKLLHISTAGISFILFISRFMLMLNHSALLQLRAIKLAPHINDTVLFISAIILITLSGYYPSIEQSWLLMKITLLLLYIGIGLVIFKSRYKTEVKVLLFLGSVLIYLLILFLATTKMSL